jgi:hypothetical protein
MKKNLRNILALSLGLMTTVAFAQDWNVDSRTRIDQSGDNDKMQTEQRITVGATWGGSDWGIHSSTEVNYDLANGATSVGVYEAYASTDLMGYANLTVGRQALDYGSGLIIGSNQWAGTTGNRNTRDGMTFGLNLDMADVTLGYASRMDDALLTNGGSGWLMNASKSDGDWTANLLYGSQSVTVADVEGDDLTYMGLDLGYSVSGVDLSLSHNTADNGTVEGDMMILGASYNVNDDMSIHASRTTVGDNGFAVNGSNYGVGAASWMTHGNMGYLAANDERMSYGGSYEMGGISLGATMHTVTNTEDATYDRGATEFSVGYSLNDNAGLSLNMASDNDGGADDVKYMWITLNVTP